jgi:glycosyltransferase involved in cell wall biosynthesis
LEAIETIRSASSLGDVKVLSRLSDLDLDRLYASATMVIQPSLEEGFGLPVLEALAGGVPVCCSDVDALREAAQGRARLFDPLSVSSITDAIDYTASAAVQELVVQPVRLIELTVRADP